MLYNRIFTSSHSLRKTCPYSELLWYLFPHILTEYPVQMRENADQNNSEYGPFSRSVRGQENKIFISKLTLLKL